MTLSSATAADLAASGSAFIATLPAFVGVAALGALLLFFGRSLYWLLLGAVGFALGFGLLAQVTVSSSPWAPLIAGLIGGVLGVAAAFFLQGAVLMVVGAVLGALGALTAVSMWGTQSTTVLLIVAAIGAAVGAVVLRKVFFAALMLVTALLGSGLLIESLSQAVVGGWAASVQLPDWILAAAYPGPTRTAAFVLLAAIGLLFQTRGRNRKREHQRSLRELRKERKKLERARRAS